jgi:hypothetical protein
VDLKKRIDFTLPLCGDGEIVDKCHRLLPLITEMLNSSHQVGGERYHLPFLSFIYWSLIHCDNSLTQKKVNLSSTFRRIGEEIYRSFNNEATNRDQLIFLNSNHYKIRLLSCLIVLRTLNQVDYIHNVFDILKKDFANTADNESDNYSEEQSIKKIFLDYFGTFTILKWCKHSNKVHFISIRIKIVF